MNSLFDNTALWESAKNHLLCLEYEELEAGEAGTRVFEYSKYYLKAEHINSGENILLFRFVALCPVCGEKNDLSVNKTDDRNNIFEMFCAWAYQYSIPEVIKDNGVVLAEWKYPITADKTVCAKCGHNGFVSQQAETYTITPSKDKIELEFFAAAVNNKLPKQSVSLVKHISKPQRSDELSDRLIFDLKTGYSTEIITENGLTGERDATFSGPQSWLSQFFEKDSDMQRALIRVFQDVLGDPSLFPDTIYSLRDATLRNRFRGYPNDFYPAIPSYEGEKTNERFRKTTSMLPLNYRDIYAAYNVFELPEKKELMKIIFKTPALLLYANEIKKLPFRNYDVLIKMLDSAEGIYFLQLYFEFPIDSFLVEYIEVKGEPEVWRNIAEDFEILVHTAAFWTLHNPEIPKQALFSGSLKEISQRLSDMLLFKSSLPYAYSDKERNLESSIGGFTFRLPKTMNEITAAAEELQNCLRTYRLQILRHETTICLVTKNRRYVAAIEINIKTRQIMQIKQQENREVAEKDDPELYKAVQKWKTDNSLS